MSPLGSVVHVDGQPYQVESGALPSGWWARPFPAGGAVVRLLCRRGEWRLAREHRGR